MEGVRNKWGEPIEIFIGEREATDLCPPEMWDMVLNYLEPKDLFNCSRVCQQMAKLLKDKIFLIGLPQTLPYILPYLRKQDLLRCFEVSRSLGNIVDDCVNQLSEAGSQVAMARIGEMELKFSNTQEINNFFDKVIQHPFTAPVNKMMYRSVSFRFTNVDSPDIHQGFLCKVEEFLRKYGEYIRNMDIYYGSNSNEDQVSECENLLFHLLSYTPDLTSYRIGGTAAQQPTQLPQSSSSSSPLLDLPVSLLQDVGQLDQLKVGSETLIPKKYQIDIQQQLSERITLARLQKFIRNLESNTTVEVAASFNSTVTNQEAFDHLGKVSRAFRPKRELTF